MPESGRTIARLDSGAEATIIRESTATSLNYETQSARPMEIVFGNGSTAVSQTEARIGRYPALVCNDEDLAEDLVSINPFLDSGFNLILRRSGGFLEHPETGEKIAISREGARWSVDLEDVCALRTGPAKIKTQKALASMLTVFAAPMKVSDSIRQRVISLHERMGHASQEVMCFACEGQRPTWTHSGLTPKQIRKVMRSEPCLICNLAKRNKSAISDPSGDRADLQPGDIISADIVGPITPITREGYKYYFLFADVATGYMHAYVGKTKTGFLSALQCTVE